MTPARRCARLAVVAIATAMVVACGHVVAGVAVKQPLTGEADCASVSAAMSTIDPTHAGEPVVRIPQPQNWERTTKLDSVLIRYVMGNSALRANGFSPVAVVTLEDVTKLGSADAIIAKEFDGLTTMARATDLVTVSDRSVCGFPAQTVTFKLPQMGEIPPRTGIALCVVTTGVRKYAAVLNLQTAAPDNPTYAADSKMILDGFQVLPETGGSP